MADTLLDDLDERDSKPKKQKKNKGISYDDTDASVTDAVAAGEPPAPASG